MWHGHSLVLSRSRTVAIDPAPQPMPEALQGKPWIKLYRATSDEFFRTHAKEQTLKGHPLDLVFIDGLHEFVQVVRDFENVERWSHRETVVVIHDVLPPDVHHAARTYRPAQWTGDVWRIVPFLEEHRPDLTRYLVDVPPSGVLIVTGLDGNEQEMARRAAALERDFPPDGPRYLELVEDWIRSARPLQAEEMLRQLATVRHIDGTAAQ